jgi:hypothetical protein
LSSEVRFDSSSSMMSTVGSGNGSIFFPGPLPMSK